MSVCISGAGIAGTALAWGLARAGYSVTVVEKAAAMSPHGQSIDVQHSAIKILRHMGVYDEVVRHHTGEKGTHILGADGRPVGIMPMGKGKISPTSQYEILRGHLASVLAGATRDNPLVTYRWGTTINEVSQSGNNQGGDEGPVSVRLSNGETQHYDLVAIADGQWSPLRDKCFPKDAVNLRDIGMYTAYWTLPRQEHDQDVWQIYHGLKKRVLWLRPDPIGSMRGGLTKLPPPCEDAEWKRVSRGTKAERIALLRRDFADAGWQTQRLLDSLDSAPDFHFGHVQQVRLNKWSDGRIVCLGDSAWAPSPITGMGTSLALLGAYVLAGELSLRCNVVAGKRKPPADPREALEAFERQLRPFVEETQDFPTWVPLLVHPTTALQRSILHRLFALASRIVAIPWVARLAGDIEDEDFKLPHYPVLAGSVAAGEKLHSAPPASEKGVEAAS